MLFNSPQFLAFFAITAILYFLIPFRFRWLLLLGASAAFYMAWNAVYILLLLVPSTVDFAAARSMGRTASRRARAFLLVASLAVNLGLLFYFKYYNFFADALRPLLPLPTLDVLLPVGISFYTFQAMGYTIDVYRGRQEPVHNFGRFLLYILYFPQLVAGPIERPQSLLPQLDRPVSFDDARASIGLRWVLWGLFKKVVVADRLAVVVDAVYADPKAFGGPELILATVFFAFQIYCDFSGYTDIAMGVSKILGIDLMKNFRKPYFATSVADFWRRWHISLSTWFRDYLYVPLGGNRGSFARTQINIAIVFLLSGFWHGANWTFLIWGGLHAAYFIAGQMLERSGAPRLPRPVGVALTFVLVTFAWIFFRARNLGDALHVAGHLHQGFAGGLSPARLGVPGFDLWVNAGLVGLLLAVEWVSGDGEPADLPIGRPAWLRWAGYYALLLLILSLGVFDLSPFIYFQF